MRFDSLIAHSISAAQCRNSEFDRCGWDAYRRCGRGKPHHIYWPPGCGNIVASVCLGLAARKTYTDRHPPPVRRKTLSICSPKISEILPGVTFELSGCVFVWAAQVLEKCKLREKTHRVAKSCDKHCWDDCEGKQLIELNGCVCCNQNGEKLSSSETCLNREIIRFVIVLIRICSAVRVHSTVKKEKS